MQGIEIDKETELQIDLNVTSYIPDEYIKESNQKIEIYQKIALCQNEEDIENVVDEIIDRFGNMPDELENLIEIARIKYLAKKLKIEKIASVKTSVVFTFETTNNTESLNIDLVELIKKYGTKIKFSPGVKTRLTLEIGSKNERQILNDTTELLKDLIKE